MRLKLQFALCLVMFTVINIAVADLGNGYPVYSYSKTKVAVESTLMSLKLDVPQPDVRGDNSEMWNFLSGRFNNLVIKIGRQDFATHFAASEVAYKGTDVAPCNVGNAQGDLYLGRVLVCLASFTELFRDTELNAQRNLVVDFILAHELSHFIMNKFTDNSPSHFSPNGIYQGEEEGRQTEDPDATHAEIDMMALILLEKMGYSKEELSKKTVHLVHFLCELRISHCGEGVSEPMIKNREEELPELVICKFFGLKELAKGHISQSR